MTRVVDRAAGKVDLLDGLTSIAVDEVAYRKVIWSFPTAVLHVRHGRGSRWDPREGRG